ALPSPINQARTMHEVLAAAARANQRVNLIEAYDQPWKRRLEGTVGGHWGLYDAYRRQPKFAWGGAVSNHPRWPWQAGGGVVLAAAVFAAGLVTRRLRAAAAARSLWPRIAGIAVVAGTLIGWTAEQVPLESLTLGDWLRSLAWLAVALLAPGAGAAALAAGVGAPTFAEMLGRASQHPRGRLTRLIGVLAIVLAVLAVQAALGLVFDPRYRDFPFAPLTGATVALLLAVPAASWRLRPQAPAAETAAAATLATAAVY